MVKSVLDAVYLPTKTFIIAILSVSVLQWIAVQLYVSFCSTWSFYGPFQNIVSLGSPPCHFLNHFQISLSDYYITIWAGVASATVAWITKRLID